MKAQADSSVNEELLKGQDNILLVKFDEATLILLRHEEKEGSKGKKGEDCYLAR